jgi:transglutaminase-like putative cysteine protease
MPVVSIRHLTEYRYRNPVAFGEHRVMYRPLESHDQRVISAELTASPEPTMIRHAHDVGGATVGVARFNARANRLRFESRVRLEHTADAPFELEDNDARLGGGFAYHADELPELERSLARRHPDGGDVEAFARRFLRPVGGTRPSVLLSDMTHAIRGEFTYGVRLEGAPQTPCETLETRRGSCRDFAVLMMEAARSLGVAARFVSGYVCAGMGKSGHVGGGHTHAWMRAYIPGAGWVDFDPTNGIVGNADLIRVACVADPRLAIPLHGTWSGLRSDFLGMDVEVEVRAEAPPFSQPVSPLRVARGG